MWYIIDYTFNPQQGGAADVAESHLNPSSEMEGRIYI